MVNSKILPTLILTGDGSHTLRYGPNGPTFHSLHGAVTESRHIYQGAGLLYALQTMRWSKSRARGNGVLRMLEIGLGTGLNAALVLETCRESFLDLAIEYTALEPQPLDPVVVSSINYGTYLRSEAWTDWSKAYPQIWASMGQDGWAEWSPFAGQGTCHFKLRTDPWPVVLGECFDLVFWDAFGPGEAPELWDGTTWSALDRVTESGAVMVTFGASGALGRALKNLGWEVQRLPGPPGKREMIRAKKP